MSRGETWRCETRDLMIPKATARNSAVGLTALAALDDPAFGLTRPIVGTRLPIRYVI